MLRAAVRLRSLVLASTLLLAACNALFGIESAGFEPPSGTTTPDGEAPRDATPVLAVDAQQADPDAGPCVDLASNARHCGACFHSCFGGTCREGKCQPHALAQEVAGDIYGLAVGGGSVFYNEVKTASIRRVPLAGGPPTLFHKSDTLIGTRLTVHGDALYFIDAGAVVRCPIAGCSGGPQERVRATEPIGSFAIDADDSIVVAMSGAGGSIGRCAGDAPCNPSLGTLRAVAINEDKPANVAVAGPWIAWTLFGATGGAQSLRFGAVGIEPRTLVTGSFILNLTMTRDRIVYGNPNESIIAISHDALERQTLATTKHATDFLVIDGDTVLYADKSNRAVLRVALDGKTLPAPIATDQANPRAIAADATSFYWVNVDTSTVMRLAR